MRLKRVSCAGPGYRRERTRDGFRYVDEAGRVIEDPAVLSRIEALVIPPAWEDVWICPIATGHVQATGVDAKGRRQYRYHDEWRRQRDLDKHDRVLDFAEALPAARARMRSDLELRGLPRYRVLACAVRLIDLGFFRIGGEQYAEEGTGYGVATLRKEHVRVCRDGTVVFDFVGKSGKQQVKSLAEPQVLSVLSTLKRRRGGGEELLAWREGTSWVDVRSGDINAYLREVTGGDFSAKYFRTWAATVLAATGLAVSTGAESPAARKRAVARVLREVATQLGNTPAVCRASYVDPRLFDLYEAGVTIAQDVGQIGEGASYGEPAFQGLFEEAVLRLLRDAPAQQLRAG